MKLSSGVQDPPQHRDQELRPYIEPDLNIFVCNNGILDLDRGIFRNRESNDPLPNSGMLYSQPNEQHIKEYHAVLESVFHSSARRAPLAVAPAEALLF